MAKVAESRPVERPLAGGQAGGFLPLGAVWGRFDSLSGLMLAAGLLGLATFRTVDPYVALTFVALLGLAWVSLRPLRVYRGALTLTGIALVSRYYLGQLDAGHNAWVTAGLGVVFGLVVVAGVGLITRPGWLLRAAVPQRCSWRGLYLLLAVSLAVQVAAVALAWGDFYLRPQALADYYSHYYLPGHCLLAGLAFFIEQATTPYWRQAALGPVGLALWLLLAAPDLNWLILTAAVFPIPLTAAILTLGWGAGLAGWVLFWGVYAWRLPATAGVEGGYLLAASIIFVTSATVTIVGHLLVLRLQRALKRERQASEAKTNLILGLSHELRTPVAVLQGGVALLERQTHQGEAALRPLIARLNAPLARLSRTAADLERLARPGAALSLSPVDLRAVLDGAIAANASRPVACTYHTPQTWVQGDREAVERILAELIQNACLYGGAETPVTVTVAAVERHVRVEIGNRLAGEPGEVARLLTPFTRGQGITAAIPGRGMGLTMAKLLAEAQQGRLQVAAQAGRFTTTVYLPKGDAPCAHAP